MLAFYISNKYIKSSLTVPASQRLEDVANFITYVITHMELGRTSIDRESRASKVG